MMIYRQAHRGGEWVDLERPTPGEIRSIVEEFSISERIEAELLSPTPSPLVAGDESGMLLVLHFPSHDGITDGESKSQELDFVVGRDFILTVRYEVIAPLHHLKKLLETEAFLAEGAPLSTDVLLEILFAHLYAAVRDHANRSADRLAAVERAMFGGHERTAVRTISEVSREFLHLDASLANQEEPLARFLHSLEARSFFGPSFGERVTRIAAHRLQVAHLVHTLRAIAAELRETNNALLNAAQNEIIKRLTVANFIFLPLGLITWTFTMRTEGMPLVASHDSFWIVTGAMAAVALILTAFFAAKRWL
jgi:magnesium transporter